MVEGLQWTLVAVTLCASALSLWLSLHPALPSLGAIETRVKELEAEWEAVYNQFRRLAGQISKTEALERPSKRPAGQEAPAAMPSRDDLLAAHLRRQQ